jgi:trigger factor
MQRQKEKGKAVLEVETELLEDHQARLVVSVEPERVQKALQAAARRISKQVDIPGFRRGKAPYHIIARHFGEEAIYDEALDTLGQTVYKEALEQSGLQPYAAGLLEDVSYEPLVLTFTVPLAPEIDLGAYRDVRIPFEPPEVSDARVEEELRNLQRDEAILEPVERAIQMGDLASLDIRGTLVGSEEDAEDAGQDDEQRLLLDQKAAPVDVAEDARLPMPGFAEKVVGMAVGDEREFDLTLPTDDDDVHAELRGRTVHFEVKCVEVYRQEVPDLDDEFAQSVGDYESLADLESDIRARLERAAERRVRDEHLDRVLTHLVEDEVVHVKYPPIMLEEQIDDTVEDLGHRLNREGLDLEAYLTINKMTEDELRDDFREGAARQLTRGLIMGKLVELEKLSVSPEEIEDEIKTRVLTYGAQAGLAQQFASTPQVREVITSELLVNKAIERLLMIASGEAPDLDALEADEEVEAPSDEAAEVASEAPADGDEV